MNFQVGEVVVAKIVRVFPRLFKVGGEYTVREVANTCNGILLHEVADPPQDPSRPNAKIFWAGDCFERKVNNLSMTFTEKIKEDRRVLILNN